MHVRIGEEHYILLSQQDCAIVHYANWSSVLIHSLRVYTVQSYWELFLLKMARFIHWTVEFTTHTFTKQTRIHDKQISKSLIIDPHEECQVYLLFGVKQLVQQHVFKIFCKMHKYVWNKLNDWTLSTMHIITGQTYVVIFSTLFLQMNATHHYLINGIL